MNWIVLVLLSVYEHTVDAWAAAAALRRYKAQVSFGVEAQSQCQLALLCKGACCAVLIAPVQHVVAA
jgi:hypothetical protein